MSQTINAQDFAQRSGITYRQLNWWVQHGLVSPVGESRPGSGKVREFLVSDIPKVELLGKVSSSITGSGARQGVRLDLLKRILESFEDGLEFIILDEWDGNYLELRWGD